MSEILNKIDETRKQTNEIKNMVKEKVENTEGNEQLFWVNFLIEIKDIDYRLYDMQNTIPKYEG